MGKVSFSHKIDESFAECFEKLYARLGPPKFRILEVAIEVFDSLPLDTQHLLKSYNQDKRELIYQILGTVRLDSIQTVDVSKAAKEAVCQASSQARKAKPRKKKPYKSGESA